MRMPQFTVSVCFRRPGIAWDQGTSRDITTVTEADNGVQAVMTVLGSIEFDERAELVHFIHVGHPDP